MAIRIAVLACLWLAACGADGAPKPPSTTAATGMTMTGSAEMGVARDGEAQN